MSNLEYLRTLTNFIKKNLMWMHDPGKSGCGSTPRTARESCCNASALSQRQPAQHAQQTGLAAAVRADGVLQTYPVDVELNRQPAAMVRAETA